MSVETTPKEVAPQPVNDLGGNVPSTFITKLYSMVNEADGIEWTPAGDAFIIGSDLHRLESETLPKFFRHARFASLVRQLNFYSFRKVNKERNVWIYKHNLFHRDRPEELHMVRRRTCPGVDGRKQRFFRLSAQRFSSKFQDTTIANNSDNEDNLSSSEEDGSVGEVVVGRKRDIPMTPPVAKKSRTCTTDGAEEKVTKAVVADDTSVHQSNMSPSIFSPSSDEPVSLGSDVLTDDTSESRKFDRVEMMQQSLVVSEVASKLEQYVKKAMKEKGLSRTRRGGTGIVTPPFGTSGRFTMNSSDLVTYDDEYDSIAHNEGGSLGVVSESEDIFSLQDVATNNHTIDQDVDVAPVDDLETVKRVRYEILRRATDKNEDVIRACANVAAFFMLTAPNEDAEECCPKIVELLSTSKKLERDFYFYRAALHPSLFLDTNRSHTPQGNFTEMHSTALRNSLSEGAARSEALREFKVFAVNLIIKLLGMNGSLEIKEPIFGEDHNILLRTAESWSRGIGIGA